MSVIYIGSGSVRNFMTILNYDFGKWNYLYRFMNFINAILLYSMARCFPMHVLGPPEKPENANPGRFLHSLSHLYGLN